MGVELGRLSLAVGDPGAEGEDGEQQENVAEPRDFVAQREREPMDEFHDNRMYFMGGFPYLFPFGKDLPTNGTVPPSFAKHLLQQCSCCERSAHL